MLTAVLLSSTLYCALPLPESPAGPEVSAVEIIEVRRARLKPPEPSAGSTFSFDETGLKLVVEVKGADVAGASHFGMLELAEATADQGGKLKLNERAFGFHDARSEFVPIDRERMYFGQEHPPQDCILVEIPFELPVRTAATFSVRGKLQLKKVETVDLLVPTTEGEVKNEQLKKLGLTFKVVKSEQPNSIAFEVKGELEALHAVDVVDAQGKPLDTSGSSSMGDEETSYRDISLENPVPADAKLKLSLVVKSEDVPVAFELKDLKLP